MVPAGGMDDLIAETMAIRSEKARQNRAYPVLGKEEVRQSINACQQIVSGNASAARTRANRDLTSHLRSLIDRADTSDLEFICKDKVKVQACRIFLLGRSPVFDKMLTNGMLKTTSLTINMPEISSSSLLSILEFLYTGNIVHYGPKDWRMGLEIMSAAHFFLLADVERIIQDYLATEIVGVVTNFQQMAVMLTIAMTFKTLSHDKGVILLQLVRLLEWKWTDTDLAHCLSEEALDFILRHTKPATNKEETIASSLVEYFCFRGIILWCACNSDFASVGDEATQLVNEAASPAIPSVQANELVNGLTPFLEANEPGNEVTPSLEADWLLSGAAPQIQVNEFASGAISAMDAVRLVNRAIPLAREELYSKGTTELSTMDVTWLPKYKERGAQDDMIQFVLSHQALKKAAMRLLVHLDWVCMPVGLFVKVVEPLKLIPDSKVVDIFRFHSIHRPLRVKLNWVHNPSCKIQSDEFVIQKSMNVDGSAMCQLANRLGDKVSVWRFTIKEFWSDVQLGFLCGEQIDEASRAWISENTNLRALGAAGVSKGFMSRMIHRKWSSGTKERVLFQRGGGRFVSLDVKSLQRVEFRYHRTKRRCDVTVDEKGLGTIWTFLAGRSVFPIVSFGDSDRGRVRLDIISGFEIL